MNFKLELAGLLIVLLASTAFGATPTIYDVNVGFQDPAYTNNPTVTVYINADGNAVKMNFSCDGSTYTLADQSYNPTGSFDLNMNGSGCNNSDGSKTVYVRVHDGNLNNSATATDSITLDRSKPSTSTNNTGNWYNSSPSISLTCTDSTSDCNHVVWQVNGGGWNTNYGSSASVNMSAYGDGNHAIDYYSVDKANNTELAKTAYILIDTAAPTVNIQSPANADNNVVSQSVSFDVNHNANAPIKLSSIDVDLNGANSSDFSTSSHCTASGNNYHCAYTETGLQVGNRDYNLAVYAEDDAGNKTRLASIFHYNDFTAPAQASTPLFSSSGTGSITFVWSKNNESDMNYYEIYRDTNTNDLNVFNKADLVGKHLHSSCSSGTCTYTDSNGLSNDQNYYYKIRAVDLTGNQGTASNVSGAMQAQSGSLAAPSISSSTHSSQSSWYTADDITVSWGTVSGANGYSYTLDQSSGTTPDTASEGTGTSTSYNDKDNGTWYFHVRACSGTNCGSASHYTINIDDAAPGTPSGLSASVSTNDVTISWNSVSDTSGIQKYYVYRSTSSSGFSADDGTKIGETSSTSYGDNDKGNDTYYYRVKAVDNAGNVSGQSDSVTATVSYTNNNEDECDFTVSIDLPEYFKAGTHTFTVSGGTMYDASLKVKKYGEGYSQTFASYSPGSNTSSFSNTYTFDSDDDGTGWAYLVAEDDDGDQCTKTKSFIVDSRQPDVRWVSPVANQKLKGDVWLEVEAEDETEADTASGVKKVTFYYGDNKITSVSSPISGVYKASWDVSGLESKTWTLKAVAEDNAGNTREASLSVNIENLPSEGMGAQAAVQAAEADKALTEALVDSFNAKGIALPEGMAALKDEADGKLLQAKSDFAAENWSGAEAKAEEAEAKYEELNSGYSLAGYGAAQEYSFATEDLESLYQALGLDESLLAEAVANAEENGLTRTLNLVEVKENGNSSYGVSVTLVLTNNSDEVKTWKVVEVVPKSLTPFASNLSSNAAFNVIEDDPVLEFNLGTVMPGETVEITYGLKALVNQFTADSLADNKGVESFKGPPIVLDSETAFEKGMVSPGTGFFVLPSLDTGLVALGVIIVFIIALVVVVGGGLAVYKGSASEPSKRKKFEWVDPETNKGWSFKKERDGW